MSSAIQYDPAFSTAEIVEEQVERVLLVGETGVGKTTQMRTLPGKVFAYIFDPNAVASLKGSSIHYKAFIPDIEDIDLSVKTLKAGVGDRTVDRKGQAVKKEPKTYLEWELDFESRLASGFFDAYDWVGFDGFTTFSEIIMDRTQYLSGRLGKHPEQADYTSEMNTVKNVMKTITNLGCNIFATGHTEMVKDEASGKTYNQLVMTGRNRKRIPMRFSQIFGCLVDRDDKGAPRWFLETASSREFPIVRTTMHGLPARVDVTLDYNKTMPGAQGLGKLFMDHKLIHLKEEKK